MADIDDLKATLRAGGRAICRRDAGAYLALMARAESSHSRRSRRLRWRGRLRCGQAAETEPSPTQRASLFSPITRMSRHRQYRNYSGATRR